MYPGAACAKILSERLVIGNAVRECYTDLHAYTEATPIKLHG